MELVALKPFKKLLIVSGWISVLSGIMTLFIINIGIITNVMVLDDLYSMTIAVSIILGSVALFSKPSRSLGIWGLSIGLFMLLFTAVIFILGWMIAPFP